MSFNEENVEDYINDPYCGHGFKVSAYNDLFYLVKNMTKVNSCVHVNEDLPILLLRGDSDPCTGYDSGSEKSICALNEQGFRRMTEICYQHMRRELLHEEGKEKVLNDIVLFMLGE